MRREVRVKEPEGSGNVREWLHSFIGAPGFSNSYRYYTAILARLEAFSDPTVDIMGVSLQADRFHLHINPDYFLDQPQFLRGVLLHEVHHVVLGHLSHPKLRATAHPDLMERAMEISANEYIRELLPEGAITWERFRDAGIAPQQSTLERYERLVAARQRGDLGSSPGPSGPLELSGSRWVDDHAIEGVRDGVCVRETHDAPRRPSLSVLSKLIEQAGADLPVTNGETYRLAGRTPGRLLEELHATDVPPQTKVDWRTELRMLIDELRTPTHTYSRPNRRFPSRVGEIPGRSRQLGSRDRPRLLVAIDTSASMTDSELCEVARQLVILNRLARITIAECDVEIHRVYPFRDRVDGVVGRGGTDLRPVFARDFLREHRPDAVVYSTDGYGPYPDRAPGLKTLWVLTAGDDFFDCEWRRQTLMR